jgi:hypothetical protein
MRFVVLASLMLCSTTAFAAPAARANHADADEAAFKGTKGDTKVFDFENDNVSGDALKPDHEGVQSRTQRKWESMIKVRMHFIPQMLQMAHDV